MTARAARRMGDAGSVVEKAEASGENQGRSPRRPALGAEKGGMSKICEAPTACPMPEGTGARGPETSLPRVNPLV